VWAKMAADRQKVDVVVSVLVSAHFTIDRGVGGLSSSLDRISYSAQIGLEGSTGLIRVLRLMTVWTPPALPSCRNYHSYHLERRWHHSCSCSR